LLLEIGLHDNLGSGHLFIEGEPRGFPDAAKNKRLRYGDGPPV
jgi:hypothetical protein